MACKYLKIHYENLLVPNKNGGGHYEKVPYADECVLKKELCPDCVNCKNTQQEYDDFIKTETLCGR